MLTSLLGGSANKFEVAGYVSSSSTGTTLTAHATPGTDGAYSQIIAATANHWMGFYVAMHHGGTAVARGLIDIAIGASGSEIIIVADLPWTHAANIVNSCAYWIWIPIAIPSGTRIAARIHRCEVASQTMRVFLVGETGTIRGIPSFARATTYGTDLTNARGTVVDPGGTSNTLGANVQIVASTTNPIRGLYILGMKQDGAAVGSSWSTTYEIYVGASGSEQVLIPEFLNWEEHASNDVSACFGTGIGPLGVNLPSGVRLSAKSRASTATAGAREGQLTLIGLD